MCMFMSYDLIGGVETMLIKRCVKYEIINPGLIKGVSFKNRQFCEFKKNLKQRLPKFLRHLNNKTKQRLSKFRKL